MLTLLSTKLHKPLVRPGLVPRPYLIERLEQGLEAGRRLTLVSAAVGFGKTTLLSEWSAATDRRTAWLSLDAGDNDPTRFWSYFVTALQTVHAGLGNAAMAAARGITLEYTSRLLAALESEMEQERSPAGLVEPLSQRELEVLRLLAAGLSSTEVATELTISVSTARTHIKNIYGKLGVHRRLEAVERAKELGLV
jgi:ATP/maltotriose-dependent transcriptional regulator MalT